MSEDFRKKLEAYERGELSENEMEEMKKELEKFKSYRDHLDKMENKKKETKAGGSRNKKWKKHLRTAFIALALFLVFSIVSSVLTAVYYSWGDPSRADNYRNVIDHTLTVTDPYGYLGATSTNATPFFGLKTTRELSKQVGHDTIKAGDMEVNFRFSLMSFPERHETGHVSHNTPALVLPEAEGWELAEWDKLEQLADGTVVSAFVSFAEFQETEEVFQLFEDKEIDITWLAVNTGVEAEDEWDEGIVFDPVGFPSFPIWHEGDMILNSREEEKGLFGSRIVSESFSSPDYNAGEGEVLHKQFLKTLYFLQEHERKANNLYFGDLKLSERINFLENYGVFHYGAVITGPTKEILQLQDEPLITRMEVDEISFWNWME
ncbi:anti-sigma factor [Salipaludibacillus sp. CUR1]|uniref:anti-sigma factor n=1 Tax=Salipaludibacillus sp. CUR1 TaxID=2820003 RepID=UPI001E401377|nr:anti-sigma factor [Salipaludibacillus sp. CUR1]